VNKLLFPMLAILLVGGGCISLAPTGTNEPPTAYIDLISPTEVSPGETVRFTGHGTDPDGDVVAYRWRSSIDGDLSTIASFEAASLSAGEHTIYLKVQDNNGDWSEEVRGSVAVSTGAATTPVINSFNASPGTITSGESSTLNWNVSDAATVSIDQGIGGVGLSGVRDVYPGATTTYTLTATNVAGSVSATAQVTVSAAPPTADTTPPAAPLLLSPAPGATLPQKTAPWDFDWADSSDPESGIKRYQIQVFRPAQPPFIEEYAVNSEYSDTVEVAYPYIIGWKWKVRAQNNADLWSDWSAERTFDVEPRVAYDFVEMAPTAFWWSKSQMGGLTFGPPDTNPDGFALYRNNITLNDGHTYARVLETHPNWADNGWISGKYAGVSVPAGAKLKVKVGFITGASAGEVKFRLGKLGDAAVIQFVSDYAGGVKEAEASLAAYAGQTIDFNLGVNAEGTSAQDWAAWIEAKMVY